MAQGAGLGVLADVSDQLDRAAIVAVHFHAAAFRLTRDRRDRDVAAERAAAALVHDARGSAHFFVAKGRDVLLHEIHKPAFALQQREQLERRRRIDRFGLARRGRRPRRFGWRRLGQLGGGAPQRERTRGERAVEQHAEEANERKPDASGQRQGGVHGARV